MVWMVGMVVTVEVSVLILLACNLLLMLLLLMWILGLLLGCLMKWTLRFCVSVVSVLVVLGWTLWCSVVSLVV